MEKITKTYEIFEYKELTKEIKKSVKDFLTSSLMRNQIMSGGRTDEKFLKALVKYVDKEVRLVGYFKNGEIASII